MLPCRPRRASARVTSTKSCTPVTWPSAMLRLPISERSTRIGTSVPCSPPMLRSYAPLFSSAHDRANCGGSAPGSRSGLVPRDGRTVGCRSGLCSGSAAPLCPSNETVMRRSFSPDIALRGSFGRATAQTTGCPCSRSVRDTAGCASSVTGARTYAYVTVEVRTRARGGGGSEQS